MAHMYVDKEEKEKTNLFIVITPPTEGWTSMSLSLGKSDFHASHSG